MILFGFIGETAINASSGGEFNLIGFAMFGVSMLAWLFILFVLYSTVTEAAADKYARFNKVYLSLNCLF